MITYLAGPIAGCTDNEANLWRTLAKQELGEENCLDPMRRDYRGKEDECVDEIVELDKEDIQNSDVVIANCWKAGWGTPMEIFYAHSLDMPVIAVVPRDSKVSPWLIYHTVAIVHDVHEAVKVAKSYG